MKKYFIIFNIFIFFIFIMIDNFIKSYFSISNFFNKKYFVSFKNLFYQTYPPENYIEEEFKNIIKEQKKYLEEEKKQKKIIEEFEKFNKQFSKGFITSLIYIKEYNKQNPIKTCYNNIKYKISNNKLTKKINSIYKKSDLYLLLNDFTTSLDNLLFNIKFSNNPIISNIFNIIHKINFKSSISNSLNIWNNNSKIKINDITHLENQIQYIFKEMIFAYYNNDIEKMKKISGKSVFALFEALNGKNKKYPLYIDIPIIMNAEILNSDNALIHFKINVLELVNNEKIENNTYYVDVIRNNSYINELGHNLFIANLQRIDNTELLI